MSCLVKERETEKEEVMRPYRADLLNPFELKQTLTRTQWLKVGLMSILVPVRLLLMLFVLSFAWSLCVLSLIGLPREEAEGIEPLSGWRRRWMKPFLSHLGRFVFFIGGYLWVPQKGSRASRSEAPILLMVPHSSFLDTALVVALNSPSVVVKDYTTRAPFFGDLIRYTQPLYVSSENSDSRHRISEVIRQRARSEKDFEQLLLFPEGGCGNRKAILQFKTGAFMPGVPVQPVFIRYKNNLDTVTWTWEGPGAWNRLLLSLTQFRIHCELEFLPVYTPSEIEKNSPRLYANNVQNYISRWTGCPATHFALEDARFLPTARELNLLPTAPLVKFLRARKSIGRHTMDPTEEIDYLHRRNSDKNVPEGDASKVAEYLGIRRCPEALMDFFRVTNQSGKEKLDAQIYAASLHLIRSDITAKHKFKAALQAFASIGETKHSPTLQLLWRGMPAHFSSLKELNHFEKNVSDDFSLRSH